MDEQRIKALEEKVEKLDRLVYRLFRDVKALRMEASASEQEKGGQAA
jgi:phosphate uptake regulator